MIKADQRHPPRPPSQLLAFLASLTSFLLYNDLPSIRSRSPRGHRCAQGDKSSKCTSPRKEADVFQRHGFSISGARIDISKLLYSKDDHFVTDLLFSKTMSHDVPQIPSLLINEIPIYRKIKIQG
jgi:hypothetical protein